MRDWTDWIASSLQGAVMVCLTYILTFQSRLRIARACCVTLNSGGGISPRNICETAPTFQFFPNFNVIVRTRAPQPESWCCFRPTQAIRLRRSKRISRLSANLSGDDLMEDQK